MFNLKLFFFFSFKAVDSCGPEVAALKRSIRKLENKLLIGTWQVEHLQMHKYFRPFQTDVSNSDKPETDTAPGVNHNRSGALDSADVTLMKPLPPAGNLIVHDKGKKSSHLIIYVFGCAIYRAFAHI